MPWAGTGTLVQWFPGDQRRKSHPVPVVAIVCAPTHTLPASYATYCAMSSNGTLIHCQVLPSQCSSSEVSGPLSTCPFLIRSAVAQMLVPLTASMSTAYGFSPLGTDGAGRRTLVHVRPL